MRFWAHEVPCDMLLSVGGCLRSSTLGVRVVCHDSQAVAKAWNAWPWVWGLDIQKTWCQNQMRKQHNWHNCFSWSWPLLSDQAKTASLQAWQPTSSFNIFRFPSDKSGQYVSWTSKYFKFSKWSKISETSATVLKWMVFDSQVVEEPIDLGRPVLIQAWSNIMVPNLDGLRPKDPLYWGH